MNELQDMGLPSGRYQDGTHIFNFKGKGSPLPVLVKCQPEALGGDGIITCRTLIGETTGLRVSKNDPRFLLKLLDLAGKMMFARPWLGTRHLIVGAEMPLTGATSRAVEHFIRATATCAAYLIEQFSNGHARV